MRTCNCNNVPQVKEMLSGNRKVQLENLLDGQEGHEGSRGKDSRKVLYCFAFLSCSR